MMNRVNGAQGVKLLECTNPVKGKWRVRWDVQAELCYVDRYE